MENIWKSWQEFNQTIAGKKVVFFGVADDWFKKTFKHSTPDLSYIVDNNPTRKGKKYFINEKYGELDVKSPEVLKEKDKNTYVVITSGAFLSIVPQLESFGLTSGKDFCCTPAMNNLKIIADFDNCRTKLLICSSEHPIYSELDKEKDSQSGGGLYLYDLATRSHKKLMSGSFHQIIDRGDKYYILDEKRGCLVLDRNFEVTKEFGFEMDCFSHGLAYCPKRKQIFIAKAGLDKISVYDEKDYSHVTDIALSEKTEKYRKDLHHVNDIYVKDDYLYLSIFSHSGNWQDGIYDGGIAQISLDDYSIRHIMVSDAWMPHGVTFIGNNIHYLDSMNSKLYQGNKNVIGTFSGFLRGLDYDGKFYFIGQSESRYFDRLVGIKDYISLSGGFYMFDPVSKAGKFFSLPTRQIRNLMVIKD
ncbi:hypothetical protein HYZ76_02100 [Candidatus Falkowbacteria bacterium]|nr:hypothetical protein [Candidatus Falkowbacteria bacterium]